MRFANTTEMSMSDATKPLRIISRLVGMNPKSHWHKIYTVFILVFEFSMLYYFSQFFIGMGFSDFYFSRLLHTLEDVFRVISLLNILGTGLFDRKRFLAPLEILARIDQGLKSVNGFIDNRKTFRFQIILSIYLGLMLSIFGWLEIIVDLLPAIDSGHEVDFVIAIDHFYYMIFVIICAVMDCSFLSTLFMIRKRFKKINFVIHCAKKYESYLTVDFFETSRARTDIHVLGVLRILRVQYHELWKIARRVNETYGLHLLVGTTISLLLIINNILFSYMHFTRLEMRNFTPVAGFIIGALFHVTRILFLVMASELTVAEAKATSVVLQELEMKGDNDRATKSQIQEFFTQLQFEEVKFSAWGFFDIDYSLICGILAAACTYLVILIQMGNSNALPMARFLNESIIS